MREQRLRKIRRPSVPAMMQRSRCNAPLRAPSSQCFRFRYLRLRRRQPISANCLFRVRPREPPHRQSRPPAIRRRPRWVTFGFPLARRRGTPEQARLDKRSHMLKIHQRLGLITIAPLVATSSRPTARVGGAAAPLDATYTPPCRRHDRGPVPYHRVLRHLRSQNCGDHDARSHPGAQGIGMDSRSGNDSDSNPGAMAFDQRSRGEKVHGIAMAHGAVAWVTAGAFAAAVVSVSFRFSKGLCSRSLFSGCYHGDAWYVMAGRWPMGVPTVHAYLSYFSPACDESEGVSHAARGKGYAAPAVAIS